MAGAATEMGMSINDKKRLLERLNNKIKNKKTAQNIDSALAIWNRKHMCSENDQLEIDSYMTPALGQGQVSFAKQTAELNLNKTMMCAGAHSVGTGDNIPTENSWYCPAMEDHDYAVVRAADGKM